MKLKLLFYFLIFTAISSLSIAQNTVGTLINTTNSFNGYTLFTSQTETYLINNCGEVVNQWTSNFPPSFAVYLLENGNLLRASKIDNPDINFGGTGGRIELFDWEGNLIWGYNYSDSTKNQHHDVYPLPNGNILVLAATVMTNQEAIDAGRDPNMLNEGILYNEQIIEIEPVGVNSANIVWEWNINDHFIQDFDNTKSNFGDVALNPNKLDINFLNGAIGNANWLHVNSMQYNANLDQIIFSARLLSEIYIIDHSTTTSEAATSTGGTYGKGGDLLYRWGNPIAYKQGVTNDQKLFGQHYPYWIADGLNDAGKIILFNNGLNRTPSFSEIFILNPPINSPGDYSYTNGTAYGPAVPDYTYTDPTDPVNFFSRILSSAQRLPNGNTLICDGDSGYFFEIDINENIVWEYYNPAHSFGIMSQGENPDDFANIVFRAFRYAPNYPAFDGRDLTPGNPIELNSNTNAPCDILSINEFSMNSISIYPNPVNDILTLESNSNIDLIELYNILGTKINSVYNTNIIDMSKLNSGIYLIKIHLNGTSLTKKIIKK